MKPIAMALGLLWPLVPAHAQDAKMGEKVFKTTCSICHSPQPGHTEVGPSLFGIIDRPAAHEPDFKYSDAMRHANLTWDIDTLNRYLPAPQQVVPGTRMVFAGLKDAKQRADLLAYLATLH